MKVLIKLLAVVATAVLLAQTAFAMPACDLQQFKNSSAAKKLTLESDPVGLAIGPKQSGTSVETVLSEYAQSNHCEFYGISMQDLVQGLLKGLDLPANAKDGNNQTDDTMSKLQGKFILIQKRKYSCMKELDLKLPAKVIS